ncbi:class I SAM-dependent methyltransferase [Methanoregula formicica]|uniref:Methyltransferase family protein n=1 Tax=Methanoregula formicica (strain DSM 22288 / NBRC 105244 / SMSP) TaxID=593750 RepID=L0HBU7_METFS|nr:methyltransferase family protein [Methanoregula formicica SMSP]
MVQKNEYTSKVVEECQICKNPHLESVLFLGYLPPVNELHPIGQQPHEQPSYPAELLCCSQCHLVQLGLIVNPKILFPKEYPYTSSTTKILRDNFAELYDECKTIVPLTKDDLIVDIGSNDGNLLNNFKDNHKVLGITPEEIGKIAISRGIPTIIDYFSPDVVNKVISEHGKAKIVTATNVFAHIDDVNEITELIKKMITPDGIFISESHYLISLIETLQYDTIYHEHLRYYSLHSLQYLLNKHGFEIIHAKRIPTHGGSIRVYAAHIGEYDVKPSVKTLLDAEQKMGFTVDRLRQFKNDIIISKLQLYELLLTIKKSGKRIYGISAPSRASTLINYTGLDDGIIDAVVEIKGSHKIGKYIPGTLIPILDESFIFENQPEFVVIFSWHIADELIPKLKEKGYLGKFIIPLPQPKII